MAEDTWKADEQKTPGGTVYKQVAPAGVAAEMTAEDPVAAGTGAALGHWLTETLGDSPALRDRVASLSGIPVSDLAGLMAGHPRFRLDTDHIQRIATALVEAQVISHADEVWKAMGPEAGASDYIVPPAQVLRTMSNNS